MDQHTEQDLDIIKTEVFDSYVKISDVKILGSAPNCQLYRKWNFWQGAFIDGRTVKLNSFCIARTETTYKLWKGIYECAIQNGYEFSNTGLKGSSGKGSDLQPVTSMFWAHCIVWCNAYTEKTIGIKECVYRSGDDDSTVIKKATNVNAENLSISQMKKNILKKGYRLPTEAEWEFAARYQGSNFLNAVKSSNFWLTKINSASGAVLPPPFQGVKLPNGSDYEDLRVETDRVALYSEYWNGEQYVEYNNLDTEVVAQRDQNYLGLYDMSGNVYEWCFDLLADSNNVNENDDDYKQNGVVVNPLGCKKGTNRVIRGGSFRFPAQNTAVGYRGFQIPNNPQNHIGFRLAWSCK